MRLTAEPWELAGLPKWGIDLFPGGYSTTFSTVRLHLEAFFIATKEKSKDHWKADRNNVTCIQCFFVTIFQLAIPAFLGLQMLLNLWQELQCYTILGRKSTPFVYVQLKNGTPSTHLVYNFACIPFHCCKCTVLFNNMNKSRSLWQKKKPERFLDFFLFAFLVAWISSDYFESLLLPQ